RAAAGVRAVAVGGPPPPRPPAPPPVQGGDPARVLVPQLQPQHLGEQRLVAVPPVPRRLDERVRVRDGRQDGAGPLVTGQLAGGLGADLLQDGRAQQDFAYLG